MKGSIVFSFLLVLSVTACIAALISLKSNHLFISMAKRHEAFSYYSDLLVDNAGSSRTCNRLAYTSTSPAVNLCLAKRNKESLKPLFKWSDFESYNKPCSFPQKNNLMYGGALSEFTCSNETYRLTESAHYRENLQIASLYKADSGRLFLASYGSITIDKIQTAGELLIIAGGSVSISNITSVSAPVIIYSATGTVEVKQTTGAGPIIVEDNEPVLPFIKKMFPLSEFARIPLSLLYNFHPNQTQ